MCENISETALLELLDVIVKGEGMTKQQRRHHLKEVRFPIQFSFENSTSSAFGARFIFTVDSALNQPGTILNSGYKFRSYSGLQHHWRPLIVLTLFHYMLTTHRDCVESFIP